MEHFTISSTADLGSAAQAFRRLATNFWTTCGQTKSFPSFSGRVVLITENVEYNR